MIVRKTYVENQVAKMFLQLPKEKLILPVDIMYILNTIPNIKILTYSKFAKANNISSIDEVIEFTDSNDGCTRYERLSDRYLILYNDYPNMPNNERRILWTLAHELGHVILKHLEYASYNNMFNGGFEEEQYKILENEANYFALNLLCPFPVINKININSPEEIKIICNLSTQASINAYNKFKIWKVTHYKTSITTSVINSFSDYIDSFNNNLKSIL